MPPRKKNTAPPIEATGLSASTMNAFNIMLQASNQSAKRTPARKTPTRKASARKAPARKAPAPNVSALNALGPNAPAPNFLGSNAPESKAPASRAPARGKSKTSTSWTHLLSRAQNRTQAINKAARQGLITTSAAQMQIAQIWKDFETTRAHLSRGFTQNPNAPGQSADVLQAAEGNPSAARQIPTEDEYEDDDEDEENMGVVETYSEYMPTKLKIGKKHPDAVVETATLASVIPPDITYQLTIPKEFINAGTLSALQLESITYASQKHEHFLPDKTRAGFLIGDGAGVGKGRTVAGIIWENFLNGRKKAIWISVSSDLKYDAERDLRDIGASNISVYPLTKMKYARISAAINGSVTEGVVFCTYSALIGGSQSSGQFRTRLAQLVQWCGDDFDGVIIFDECHRAKNLVPASGSKPTKTGMAVVELQNKLPKARVVYASATGASETKNMAYMVRLGLWGEETPFREFKDFQKTVEGRGVGAMEIVAMEMKHRGMYIARQLSFQNVAFRIEEVPLTPEFVAVYDDSVKFWVKLMDEFEHAIELVRTEGKDQNIIWAQFWGAHQRFFKYLCIAAKVKHAVKVANEGIEAGKCVVIGLQSTGEARTLDQLEADGSLSDFVSSAKGVVQSLVEKHFPGQQNSKLDVHKALGIDMAEYGEDGNDGPSNTRRSTRQPPKKKTRSDFYAADLTVLGSDSDDAFSIESDSDSDFPDYDPFAAKQVVAERGPKAKSEESESKFRRYIYASMDENSNVIGGKVTKGRKRKEVADEDGKASSKRKPGKLAMKAVKETKERLMAEIELLGARLPTNTLDQLIDELGGPDKVAEMTGRKGRVVQDCHGKVQYESREEDEVGMEDLNREEKERFMNGEKDVAIISEAASSGISLQADRRVGNQRRRVHITLELPWSADRAIQQFGRTHRSNQVSAPEYVFLISDLAGERRFASAVAKRLESLGALTHGDRRATETRDLSQYNIYTKFGRLALTAVMRSVTGNATPKVPHPADYKGDFFPDVLASLKGVGFFGKKKSEDDSSEEEEDDTALSKHYGNIPKFLNRILGLPVDLQNRLFKYFMDTLGVVITEARKAGRYDKGILDLGTEHDNVRKIKVDSFTTRHSTGTSKIELTTVEMDRGITWEAAKEKHALLFENHEGFYIQIKPTWVGNSSVALVVKGLNGTRRGADKVEQFYSLYRPNLGLMVQQETIAEIKLKYKKISVEQAERYWKEQYEFYKHKCYHMFLAGSCRNTMAGLRCVSGMRQCTYFVLSGSLLAVWDKVQEIYQRRGKNNRLQVVRMRIEGGERIVGTDIPSYCVEPVLQMLSGDTEDMDDESF